MNKFVIRQPEPEIVCLRELMTYMRLYYNKNSVIRFSCGSTHPETLPNNRECPTTGVKGLGGSKYTQKCGDCISFAGTKDQRIVITAIKLK